MKEKIKISYLPLRILLTKRNISITSIGRELGISSKIISKLNNDTDYVSLRTLVRICEHLDVPIEEVVEIKRN